MPNDLLQHIRDLQYTNRGEAEALLLGFLKEVYRPDVTSVEIRTLAISLNSFNGFLTLAEDGFDNRIASLVKQFCLIVFADHGICFGVALEEKRFTIRKRQETVKRVQ